MNNQDYLTLLKTGCRQPIYIGSFNGEEPFNIGWRCGERTYDGVKLYCIPCGDKIKKLESKLEREVK